MSVVMALIGKKPEGGQLTASSPQTLTCTFNPENLRVSLSKPQQSEAQSGGQNQSSATDANTVRLDVTLLFDTTETGTDVRRGANGTKILKTLASPNDGAPAPVITFAWGAFVFHGTIETLSETLEFWSAEGIPLRAGVQLSIAGDALDEDREPPETFTSVAAPVGGWGTTEIAARGGNSGAHRKVAADNKVENPRFPSPFDAAGKAIGQANDAIGKAQADVKDAVDGLNQDLAPLGGAVSLGSGSGAGLSLGISAGIGIKAAASFKLGFSAGASIGFGFGATAGGGAGFGIGSGAGFGVGSSLGTSAGAGSGARPTGGSTGGQTSGSLQNRSVTSSNSAVGYSGTAPPAPGGADIASATLGSASDPATPTAFAANLASTGEDSSGAGSVRQSRSLSANTAPDSPRALAGLAASQGAFAGLSDPQERPTRLNIAALTAAPDAPAPGPDTWFDVLGRANTASALDWQPSGEVGSASAARSLRLL